MEGNGPTNGQPREVGKIAASVNGFALDAVCADMVGYDVSKVETLQVGKERGLWSGRLDSIRIEGNYPKIMKFKPPSTFGAYSIFNRIMSPWIGCLPVIDKKKCKKCGLCAKQCPVGACTMGKGEFPVIVKADCIKCYCCQEFCPGDAVKLNGKMFKFTGWLA